VTAVIAAPGDRTDRVIEEAGRTAARMFDRLIIKEDADTRGRVRGEVAGLLCDAIRDANQHRECIVVFDEREAVERALDEAEAGELLVVFYDDLDAVHSVLSGRGARATIERPPIATTCARRRFGT